MAGGRPTKLTDEVIEQARAHVDSFDVSINTLLPTVEGLAIDLNISRDTLYEWAKESKEFSDILADLKVRQANKLLQNSLANRYNSTIAKLLLSSKHGYIEQTKIDAKVEQVTPILGGKTSDNVKGDINETEEGTNSAEISELIPEDD